MEGEVDPNAVIQEARSGEQKVSFYLTKAELKKNKTDKMGRKAK